MTFQAILQLNTGATPGTITFNYPDLDTGDVYRNGAAATVGIKDAGSQGDNRLLVSYNDGANPLVGSGKAIRIAVVPPATGLQQGGFESPPVGNGFQYRPIGSPWTFAGSSGISGNNSGFTSGNPAAPEGVQVAFLQTTGSFSQIRQRLGRWLLHAVLQGRPAWQPPGIPAGLQRPGRRRGGGHLHALWHLVPVLHHRRVHGHRRAHTIKFQGLDSAGGDNTAFVDQTAIVQASSSAIGDAGFEQVVVGAGQFQYRPTGSPWTFAGSAGISGNNSGFTSGNPAAPEGAQVAFLQTTGAFSQSVSGWAAGSYTLSFKAAQRGNHQASRQDFNVLVDGVVVGTFTPSGTSYQSYTTAVVHGHRRAHTIKFQGLDSAGGDNTAFVDAVAIS